MHSAALGAVPKGVEGSRDRGLSFCRMNMNNLNMNAGRASGQAAVGPALMVPDLVTPGMELARCLPLVFETLHVLFQDLQLDVLR
jgi:hypothetical protein